MGPARICAGASSNERPYREHIGADRSRVKSTLPLILLLFKG
jgi:hypothetical protein